MKKVLALSFLMLINFLAFSQGVKLTLHDFEIEKTYDPYLMAYTKNESGEFIILKKEPVRGPGGYQYYLEVRNADFEKVDVKNISEGLDGDNFPVDQIIILKEKLLIFSSRLNKEKKEEVYYQQLIDMNSMEVSDREEFYVVTYEKRRRRASVNVIPSRTKDFFLVEVHPPYNRKEQEKVTLRMYDKSLDQIWSMDDYEFEHEDRYYSIEEVEAGNKGEAYLIGKSVLDKKSQYDLFRFDGDGVEKLEVDFRENRLQDISLTMGHGNKLYLTGYYTNKETSGVKGVYYQPIDTETLEADDVVYSDYSEEMLLLGDTPKRAEKAKKRADRKDYELGVHHLSIDDVAFDKAGNIYLIGSQFHIVVTTYTDANGNTRTRYTYYYEDIYVSKFSAEGDHLFDTKIPRTQVTGRAIDSYSWIMNGEDLHFVFFDNKLNLEGNIKNEGVISLGRYKRNYLASASVSSEGEVKREILYDFVEKHKDFKMYRMIDYLHDGIFMVYLGRKQFKLGLLQGMD